MIPIILILWIASANDMAIPIPVLILAGVYIFIKGARFIIAVATVTEEEKQEFRDRIRRKDV